MPGHCSKSATDRAKEYEKQGAPFFEKDGLLFCKTCKHIVNHTRKSSLDKHLDSRRHYKKKNHPDFVNVDKSAKDLANEFPDNFCEKKEVLFCKKCDQALDHTWPSTLRGHRPTCRRPKRKAEDEDERETKRIHTSTSVSMSRHTFS